MIDLSPAQALERIPALLAAHESRTLDFKRISSKHGRLLETFAPLPIRMAAWWSWALAMRKS